MTSEAKAAAAPPQHKRHLKNFLLDKSYQLRYTAVIVLISGALTAALGVAVVWKAREGTAGIVAAAAEQTRIIKPQLALLDDEVAARVAAEMEAKDREQAKKRAENDRWLMMIIIGFGFLFCISMMGYGIVITHKVAGPLFKLSTYLNHIRDGKLGKVYDLRKGDQLHAFFSVFKEMHTSLVKRTQDEVAALDKAIQSVEKASGEDAKACAEALRVIKKQKEDSLG